MIESIILVLLVVIFITVFVKSRAKASPEINLPDEFTQIDFHVQTGEYVLELYATAKELARKEFGTKKYILYDFLVDKLEEIGIDRKARGGDGGYSYFITDVNKLRASDLYRRAYKRVKSEYENKVTEYEKSRRLEKKINNEVSND